MSEEQPQSPGPDEVEEPLRRPGIEEPEPEVPPGEHQDPRPGIDETLPPAHPGTEPELDPPITGAADRP